MKAGALPRAFSTYLNLLRAGAALVVFLTHFFFIRYRGVLAYPHHLAHEAVIVFFVLSGYVIAYVAAERERTPTDYFISRAARIYSVAIPALAITFVIDSTLLHFPAYQLAAPWKYAPVFLTFTTDFWFLNIDAFSDAPYWSLSYEVWYYGIFAAAIFLRGNRRIAALVILLALVGPRIWLLFPIWLAGVWVYYQHRSGRHRLGPVIFWCSLGLLAAIYATSADHRLDVWVNSLSGGWIVANLRYSQYFLGDWITGGLVAVNILAARNTRLSFGRTTRAIDYAAAFSFTLYLVHFPILEALKHFAVPGVAMVPCALGLVWLIGLLTEQQKDLLRRGMRRFAARFAPAPVATVRGGPGD